MNWKVRHEGSPEHLETTLEEIQHALADGLWEPTDEVMGPGEADWVPIESHPALAEIAEELEPPPPRTYDDETRLDMTPLIDVCLVLLVFFILTASVAALQTRVEAPSVSDKKSPKVKVVTKEQVEQQMVECKATLENGEPVVRVEDRVVELSKLTAEFRRYVRSTGKTTLLLDAGDDVPHDIVVKVIDAARRAGMERVDTLVP